MADIEIAWTLHLDSERIRRGSAAISRWWSGEGELTTMEGDPPVATTWLGARYPDGGMLLDVGEVQLTQTVPGRRTTIRLAVTGESVRHLLQVDLGAVDVTVGWVFRPPNGSWTRIPRYHQGRISRSAIANGEFSAEIETYWGNIDNGVPLYWSHETAAPGDLYAEMAQELSEGVETKWGT